MKLPPLLLTSARCLYRATPFHFVREWYFKLFLAAIRGRRTVATLDGITYDLDLSEIIDVSLYLRRYEPDVVSVIERCCKPGACVLDIGANIGAHALRFAKLVGASGRVYAFEPTDFAYAKLLRNISLNSFANITPVRIALSNANCPQQTIDCRSSWRTDGGRVGTPSRVDFRRLDDWLREHSVARVDLIKLDVDGHEFEILDGARELLGRDHPLLLLEVGAWHFEDRHSNPLELLCEYGYHFRWMPSLAAVDELRCLQARLPAHDPDKAFSINVIATLPHDARCAA